MLKQRVFRFMGLGYFSRLPWDVRGSQSSSLKKEEQEQA